MKMFCPDCGGELEEFGSNAYCSSCGELLVLVEEETTYALMDENVPACFTHFDGRDINCTRRCGFGGVCMDAQSNTRPECFGIMYSASEIECRVCLDSSMCQEEQLRIQKENDKMAAKVKVRPAGRRRRAPKPVVEEEVVVEADDNEDEEADYGSMPLPELRKMCKGRGLPHGGRKSQLIQRLKADDAGDDEDEEEPDAPAPVKKPAPKSRRRASKPKPEPEEEEVEAVVAPEDILQEIVEQLEAGQSVVFTATDGGYVVEYAEASQAGSGRKRSAGLTGKDFELEAYSEEFFKFIYESFDGESKKGWLELTPEERYEYAEEIGAEWEEHENPKTDAMRMGTAVRATLGIEKWKPEYATRGARKRLRDGI